MIVVRLKGGMGNQMFQYAFGKALAQILGTSVQFDCAVLLDRARGRDFVYRDYDLDIFNVQPEFSVQPDRLRTLFKLKSATVSRYIKRWAAQGRTIYKEKHFHVEQALLQQPPDGVLYDGWWQSFRYAALIEEEVRKAFEFQDSILLESQPLLEQINNTNSVCLNVRRTDFLTTPALNATNLAYFLRAAAHMAERVQNPSFFVFSDDVEWCREHIKLPHPVQVVAHTHKGRKFGNYMQLMKACKHFIIPNSSFAWWAVWLNEQQEKHVIAPKKWFNEGNHDTTDLVPENWIRL